jgi:hypothetical protein
MSSISFTSSSSYIEIVSIIVVVVEGGSIGIEVSKRNSVMVPVFEILFIKAVLVRITEVSN